MLVLKCVIPEGQPKYNDLIDIVIASAQKNINVEQKDGSVTSEQIIDEEIVWWKTLSVAANTLGRCAFELKEWERGAYSASVNMNSERASDFSHEIIEVGLSFRRSIDSKSSESMRDKQNSQSTLLDKINRNKVEKIHTFRGDMKRSVLDVFLGKEAEKEAEKD